MPSLRRRVASRAGTGFLDPVTAGAGCFPPEDAVTVPVAPHVQLALGLLEPEPVPAPPAEPRVRLVDLQPALPTLPPVPHLRPHRQRARRDDDVAQLRSPEPSLGAAASDEPRASRRFAFARGVPLPRPGHRLHRRDEAAQRPRPGGPHAEGRRGDCAVSSSSHSPETYASTASSEKASSSSSSFIPIPCILRPRDGGELREPAGTMSATAMESTVATRRPR